MTLEQLTALCNAGFTKADIANFIQPQPQTQMDQPQTQMVQPQTQMVQPQTQMVQPQTQMVQPQTQMVQPQMVQPQPQTQMVQPQSNTNVDMQLLNIIKQIQGNNLSNATGAPKAETAVDIGLGLLGNTGEVK